MAKHLPFIGKAASAWVMGSEPWRGADPTSTAGGARAHAQRSRRLPDGFLRRSANRPFRPYQPVRQSAHQPTAESQPILNRDSVSI